MMENNNNYYYKYLVYKTKYLKLKNKIQSGGIGYKLILKMDNLKVYIRGDVIFLEDKDYYRLSQFNVKTFENYFSYAKNIINFVDKYKLKKDNVLVLGFGIGGLPLKFTTYSDTKRVDSVDLNPVMYKLFDKIQDYLYIYPKSKMNNFIMLAEDYIKNTEIKYDLIIDDVFGDDKIFLDYVNISKIINKGGFLFINLHYMSDYKKLLPILKENYSSVDLIKDDELLVICQK
jgi:spermidine synthase